MSLDDRTEQQKLVHEILNRLSDISVLLQMLKDEPLSEKLQTLRNNAWVDFKEVQQLLQQLHSYK